MREQENSHLLSNHLCLKYKKKKFLSNFQYFKMLLDCPRKKNVNMLFAL